MLILHDISALEFTRAVHRQKPSGNMTERLKSPSDDERFEFPARIRCRAQLGEHLPDKAAMMPFFIFDLMDPLPLLRIRRRTPVSAVGIRGCALARVCKLKNVNKPQAVCTYRGLLSFLHHRLDNSALDSETKVKLDHRGTEVNHAIVSMSLAFPLGKA